MSTWGNFYTKHQRTGRKLLIMDSLMPATALQYHLNVVTRSTDDFSDDVPVFNPLPE